MAKRKFKREGRVFLNQYDKTCTDNVMWSVEATPNKKGVWSWTADFAASKYLSVWATKPAELRVLDRAVAEINKFRDACDEAQALCEERNAESKESD